MTLVLEQDSLSICIDMIEDVEAQVPAYSAKNKG